MAKIKICHLTFDMRIGGAEQVIKNLVEGMDSDGYECSVLCIEGPIGPFGQMMIDRGIFVTSVPRKEGFDVSLIPKIRRFLVEQRIDILHCHQYTPWVYGALAASFTKVNVVLTEHGRFYPDRSSWKRRLVNPLLLQLTDSVNAISKATRDALRDFEFIPASEIDVIYNGIHPIGTDKADTEIIRDDLCISPSTLVLGTVARLDPVKNQKMMLHAFNSILREHQDTVLLIVGDGEEMQSLTDLAIKLQIDERVIFTGYIANPINHIQIMDIFLLSSLTEGTSMTLLEAMSIGKPCVVTDAGGNSEIIEHQYNGLVTESDNAEEFTKAISSLLSDPELRSEFGRNALERFDKRFAAKHMIRNYEIKYEALRS